MSTGVFEAVRLAEPEAPPILATLPDAASGLAASEYSQLSLFDAGAVSGAEQSIKPSNGVLVQHYPRDDREIRMHVQLGRQFREEGVEIDWPESSYNRRIYLQTKTGHKFMIVGNHFHDQTASEKAGEHIYYQMDPDIALPVDLIGKPLEYLPGLETDDIEMVEISAGYSDSQGEHLDAYGMAGTDPFHKFNQRIEQIRDGRQRAEDEELMSDGVLLTDFRTYPDAEPQGLRARARRAAVKTGLAGKALMAEIRGHEDTGKHEWKYTRRKAALVAMIGTVAFGAGMSVENGLSDTPMGHGQLAGALAAPAPAASNPRPETVIPRSGDNPWEISESQLVKHGVARPSGSDIAAYDRQFLKRNFPLSNDLEQTAEHIKPGRKYLLPNFNFRKLRRKAL